VSRKLHREPKKPRSSEKLTELPSAAAHREAAQYEDDNVGVEAANRTTQAAEGGTRYAAKLSERPTRKTKAEPQGAKQQQKRGIKDAYAKARQGKSTTTATAKSAKKAAEKEKKTAQFIYRHRKGIGIAVALFLVVAFIMNALTSCSVFLQGGLNSVGLTTYPSADEDMLGAEAAYAAMEAELQDYLDSYEATHDYDEYHFDLDEISHDPYVLTSLLTALKGGEWALDDVRSDLDMLFERQYILTEDVTTYTRYDEDGDPYEYTTVTVTLENFDLSHLPVYLLTEDALSLYSLYMATLGNRPDLFPDSGYVGAYTDPKPTYEIPPEAREDEQFAAMMEEAQKYVGYPYVWGGSSPSTSFDCSGFVSWVVNNCGVGWSIGRLTAQGLYNICTPVSDAEAKPGDLVFFEYTYEGPWITHVGIYVGDGWMIHAGDPIGYIKFMDSYYSDNFVGFGRLPAV
jgi:hypothetical protein